MSASAGEGEDPRRPDQTPIRRLLEVGVLAPLGFLLEYRTVLPKLTEAGRRQVDFTRSLGRAALRTIARGTASTRSSPSRSVAGVKSRFAAVDASVAADPAWPDDSAGHVDAGDPADAHDAGDAAEAGGATGESTSAAAVAGYEAMTARDIVALMAGSDLGRVEWIAEAEAGGKARVTVMRAAAARLSRLQGER